MGRRNGFPPGTFSWVELVTADPGAASAFYERLFGWSANGDGVFRLDGDPVAGLVEGSTGWTNAITVTDAAAGELITPDLDAARAYYERRFGWTTEPFGTGMAPVLRGRVDRGLDRARPRARRDGRDGALRHPGRQPRGGRRPARCAVLALRRRPGSVSPRVRTRSR